MNIKRNYSISVAMATYNGGKYIKEQLESILKQLEDIDEIVISDDGSSDSTLKIVSQFNDKRIKVIQGPQCGINKNFENAIINCTGKYIFLADQDDIWNSTKINTVLDVFFKKKVALVIHDAEVFDTKTKKIIINSFFEFRKSRKGILKNIIKNSYIGCCMAFDSRLKKFIIPIPNSIEMHDQWIGIVCEINDDVAFINNKLIKYRRHSNNVSKMKHYSIYKMLLNRICFIRNLLKREIYDKNIYSNCNL